MSQYPSLANKEILQLINVIHTTFIAVTMHIRSVNLICRFKTVIKLSLVQYEA